MAGYVDQENVCVYVYVCTALPYSSLLNKKKSPALFEPAA